MIPTFVEKLIFQFIFIGLAVDILYILQILMNQWNNGTVIYSLAYCKLEWEEKDVRSPTSTKLKKFGVSTEQLDSAEENETMLLPVAMFWRLAFVM